ncbi:hypothetical protein GUITHDRAFT_102658 [Guillardia theta CCMP2712]|uniref:Uncharacterized protein n=1 Tax=Guillardia theta (strain CCMP2712) TaxID=905079 RepID=L1JTI7_GUITC|nr:hypothetical protein GUITHDRAFT_102658 [Guillardia theta CCMP2712]EKX51388.1 hypothetical protein GUITHDRAFT_102658 [Guillardia theta CCMP2712]|eukprot:XP_005838368.1 hypothetical protein GUITHDRAFT_102658 [Guillardia theta CCMP2712]
MNSTSREFLRTKVLAPKPSKFSVSWLPRNARRQSTALPRYEQLTTDPGLEAERLRNLFAISGYSSTLTETGLFDSTPIQSPYSPKYRRTNTSAGAPAMYESKMIKRLPEISHASQSQIQRAFIRDVLTAMRTLQLPLSPTAYTGRLPVRPPTPMQHMANMNVSIGPHQDIMPVANRRFSNIHERGSNDVMRCMQTLRVH